MDTTSTTSPFKVQIYEFGSSSLRPLGEDGDRGSAGARAKVFCSDSTYGIDLLAARYRSLIVAG
jgi:hypothetical protein